MRALGLIDEQVWEASITAHSGWFLVTWSILVLYVLIFPVSFPAAVRHSTGIRGWARCSHRVVAFLVFQGFELLFIR